jgi:hypothetical protein
MTQEFDPTAPQHSAWRAVLSAGVLPSIANAAEPLKVG